MNQRRSEIEIIEKIISLSIGGTKKTRILYQGNFSFQQLQFYLPFLIDRKIIEKKVIRNNGNSSIFYIATERGHKLLDDIHNVLTKLE